MGDYQERLGRRLRAIRKQQGLTLHQVEERSEGRWKAVVVGSYERGDRAVSVGKLAELAGFYGVPVAELLPDDGAAPDGAEDPHDISIDLRGLDLALRADVNFTPIARFVRSVQARRGDYNGRILTIRSDDVQALATVLGRPLEILLADLDARGVLARDDVSA